MYMQNTANNIAFCKIGNSKVKIETKTNPVNISINGYWSEILDPHPLHLPL